MMVKKERIGAGPARGPTLMAASGLLGALAASSCRILPLAFFSLGIGGAWIGKLTQLAPYQPYFIAATIAFLGGGYWLVYRSSKAACAVGVARNGSSRSLHQTILPTAPDRSSTGLRHFEFRAIA
jgi:mercuric ion transport protein